MARANLRPRRRPVKQSLSPKGNGTHTSFALDRLSATSKTPAGQGRENFPTFKIPFPAAVTDPSDSQGPQPQYFSDHTTHLQILSFDPEQLCMRAMPRQRYSIRFRNQQSRVSSPPPRLESVVSNNGCSSSLRKRRGGTTP